MFNFNDPHAVYNLVAQNPQARAFVESLAKMNQLQQANPNIPGMVSQFAQNPMQAMSSVGNWAQGAVDHMNQPNPQQNYAQPPQNQTPVPAPVPTEQQGGPPVNMLSQAMEIVTEFRGKMDVMNNNMKEVHDKCENLTAEVLALREENAALIKKNTDELTKLAKLFPKG